MPSSTSCSPTDNGVICCPFTIIGATFVPAGVVYLLLMVARSPMGPPNTGHFVCPLHCSRFVFLKFIKAQEMVNALRTLSHRIDHTLHACKFKNTVLSELKYCNANVRKRPTSGCQHYFFVHIQNIKMATINASKKTFRENLCQIRKHVCTNS